MDARNNQLFLVQISDTIGPGTILTSLSLTLGCLVLILVHPDQDWMVFWTLEVGRPESLYLVWSQGTQKPSQTQHFLTFVWHFLLMVCVQLLLGVELHSPLFSSFFPLWLTSYLPLKCKKKIWSKKNLKTLKYNGNIFDAYSTFLFVSYLVGKKKVVKSKYDLTTKLLKCLVFWYNLQHKLFMCNFLMYMHTSSHLILSLVFFDMVYFILLVFLLLMVPALSLPH